MNENEINEFSRAAMTVIEMAKSERRICYLYRDRGVSNWSASFHYWRDWVFKAYPGGRKEFSVSGTKIYAEIEKHLKEAGIIQDSETK